MELRAHHVPALLLLHVRALLHAQHLRRSGDKAFRVEETEHQLLVMARCAHGDTEAHFPAVIQRAVTEADLERFLRYQDVIRSDAFPAIHADDGDRGHWRTHAAR